MSRSIKFQAMLVLLIALGITEIAAEVPCPEVLKSLTPCLSFIKGESDPSPPCCSGAQLLEKQATTKEDRQGVCDCLKGILPKIGPYEPNRVPQIGPKCGLHVAIPPISPTTDCSKVKSYSWEM